uniref:tetratricopeptide repeat protein n=1 Tax=Mariniphaga sediminis TaxID=1628158 RepID=UPI0035675520
MDNKKNIIGFFFFLFLFLVEGKETILAVSQDVSAVKAMQLFDAGKYVEAEKMFQLLLEKDGGNPMLNYYYGASRTENGHFDDRDLKYLQDAGKNVTPDRLHYYLGIQYHARNKWEQALKFYNQFRQSIPVEEQKTLNMAEKIQQCFDKINPFATGPVTFATEKNEPETESGEVPLREMREEPAHTEPEMPDAPKKPEADSVVEMPLTKTPEEGTTPPSPETQDAAHLSFAREALPDLPGVKATHSLPEGDPIEFQVNNTITYLYSSQFQTEEGRELFKKGRSLQKELENSLKEAESLRETYRNTNNPEEKAAIGEKILAFETNSYGRQEEINQYFSSSRNLENEYWNNARFEGDPNYSSSAQPSLVYVVSVD